MNNHNTHVVVNTLSGVVGYGGGLHAAAFVLVLFILLVIVLRTGIGIY
jgi:hypothetical protein